MSDPGQPIVHRIKLELYITEPELKFLTAIAHKLNEHETPRPVTIQDVIRALIRTRMRDEETA